MAATAGVASVRMSQSFQLVTGSARKVVEAFLQQEGKERAEHVAADRRIR
jgi:hypothetical protein